MKNWKSLIAFGIVAVMMFSFAACGTTPVEPTDPAPETTEPTEFVIPTLDPATYKDFIGTWYADGSSAGIRIIVKEGDAWQCTDAKGESLMSGNLDLGETENSLVLYDPDGAQALILSLEEAGKLYVEIYVDTLMETLNTNYFLNEITNDNADYSPVEDGGQDTPADEIPTDAPITDDMG